MLQSPYEFKHRQALTLPANMAHSLPSEELCAALLKISTFAALLRKHAAHRHTEFVSECVECVLVGILQAVPETRVSTTVPDARAFSYLLVALCVLTNFINSTAKHAECRCRAHVSSLCPPMRLFVSFPVRLLIVRPVNPVSLGSSRVARSLFAIAVNVSMWTSVSGRSPSHW